MNIHPSAIKRELEDWLRYNLSNRQLLARLIYARSDWCRDPLKRLDLLCKTIRLAAPSRFRNILFQKAEELADSSIISKERLLSSSVSFEEESIHRGILLKPRISDREPGVILISFEVEWARLLHMDKLAEFAENYHLVVVPSWSPPHSPVNYLFPRFYPRPVFTLISNPSDLDFFPEMSKNYRPIELYASNWVNPDLFHPKAKDQRDIDILMVANFARFKRHHVLFKAMKQMAPELKVVLIGQPYDGRSAQSIIEEASFYGVQDRIVVRECVYGDELMDIFCRAKVSLVLSKREGSCVVVTESLFADTPVGLLEDAEIGSKVFINDHTGRLLNEENLAEELSELINAHATFRPREWALDNRICCRSSTEILNNKLKSQAINSGEQWTTNIIPHHWRPDPVYLNAEDCKPASKEVLSINQKFGVELMLEKEKG